MQAAWNGYVRSSDDGHEPFSLTARQKNPLIVGEGWTPGWL